jgi:hypothetical protein
MGTGEADLDRGIGLFGEKTSDSQTVCNPVWLTLLGLPVLPVKKSLNQPGRNNIEKLYKHLFVAEKNGRHNACR